jgi:phenylacetate-CoA ligase
MHIWSDYIYVEIIDPITGAKMPDGEIGEIVISTLRKEAAPLVRYRTRDLSRIVPGLCECGLPYPRIDSIIGRSDDIVRVHGTTIFPAQVDELLATIDNVSSEYQIMIDHMNGRDILTLFFETHIKQAKAVTELEKAVNTEFKKKIGLTPKSKAVGMGDLPRSEKKTTRVFDNRY